MIRDPPGSTLDRWAAASDVDKRQVLAKGQSGVARTDLHVFARIGDALADLIVHAPCTEVGEGAREGDLAADGEAGRNAHPVSYTHLRAHETVLGLLCRLLLEKKK
mgnify:CR=1 FL=1